MFYLLLLRLLEEGTLSPMICIFCWKSWPGPALSILLTLPAFALDEDEDVDDDDVATAKDMEVLAAGGEGEVCIM